MDEPSDQELLRKFAASQCEESFAALVARHVQLVHSVACRHADRNDQAQEITQAVFTLFARKAAALRAGTVVAGWLYETARLVAANHRRAEVRRFKREQEAYLQSTSDESAEPQPAWDDLRPFLDEAMGSLAARDRDAIVLRYLENRTLRETSSLLGVEERAGQKRVARALEKLRQKFLKRGILSTSATLGLALAAGSAHAAHAAPGALATTISATALKGSVVAPSVSILIKQTLHIMAWTKAKTITATVVVLLLSGGTVIAVKNARQPDLVAKIKEANTGLPEAQTQAKMLIFTAMSQNKIPAAGGWCETLNQNGKLWASVPTNTLFVVNANVAGRAYGKKEIVSGEIPARTVVFFETEKSGWNQAGGAELAPKDKPFAVAFADGSAAIVSYTEARQLQWMP